ncbi:MFS transporter [Endozoicomonas sp. OPT23]|uniref:organoarsenical effux MFS transporter ArsJ n=1 Tax=Endozoicomonas sp. OPT23 TaxID=2072845 RepID=UPI00129BBA41|nr:organoarsenical effux MFS transporter ArsJ [Endozoicomonas sp. OPT23]MRI32922.1 MFS transporter [Endozoicomonas sp. OPT23]
MGRVTAEKLSPEIRQYLIVTGNYWAFTLTDGALRMLVVLHFHMLGYSPFEVAMLFLFYEFFGVITNLFGGWLGARIGLNRTMSIGLFMQIVALAMLAVPSAMLVVPWVMFAQALSGIAKDLNKMSAKSSIKGLVSAGAEGKLYKWVALLTGSKNALKGVGFFLGGFLLATIGFKGAVIAMAAALSLVWVFCLLSLKQDLGKAKNKPKFSEIFSKSSSVNRLSAARLFLFGARDVWFVVALPIFLGDALGWSTSEVGAFMALWVIGYGFVQANAPRITGRGTYKTKSNKTPDGKSATLWAALLASIPAAIALGLMYLDNSQITLVIVIGLMVFGAIFAINSSLHSYLIVIYAKEDGASMDVGFYYMANAMGRLIGTVLSGYVYQVAGLEACLWISASFVALAAMLSVSLPRHIQSHQDS